jgi:trk system potassium uptake protein TrkH
MIKNIAKKGQLSMLLSFALFIIVGTFLLKLPWIMKSNIALSWTDALYMSTSAVCVNGLAVVNVNEMSILGQFILLILMQIGGLGIITMSSSILLTLGKSLSFSDTLLISSLNDNFSLRGTEGLVKTVIKYVLFSEAIGFVIIFIGCLFNGEGFFSSIWNSLFLAVSAFCNAGFSPYCNSVANCHFISQLGILLLGIGGGIGIYAVYDIQQTILKKQYRLKVFTKLVLWATVILLIAGAILIWVWGSSNNQNISIFEALFLSASARSFGFTIVPLTALPDSSIELLILLMLIGGCPGSTAGGMKTSTVALALAAIWNSFQGNQKVLLWGRRIPSANVMKAFTMIVVFFLFALVGVLAIETAMPNYNTTNLIFEAFSAICTVGLSIGDTSTSLNLNGKLVVTLLMFIGRMGPFTIMLFLMGRDKSSNLQYPTEQIIIG